MVINRNSTVVNNVIFTIFGTIPLSPPLLGYSLFRRHEKVVIHYNSELTINDYNTLHNNMN